VTSVTLANAPSLASHVDTMITVPGYGELTVDVTYEGMFYMLVEAAAAGLAIDRASAGELVRVGEIIKRAAREQLTVVHPANSGIDHLESLLWTGPQTEITGQAWITGYSEHVVQDDDPFPEGFVLRDFA
jgi:proline racemase